MNNRFIFWSALICIVLSFLPFSWLSIAARLALVLYFLGASICSFFEQATVVDHIAVSIALSTALLLLISLLFAPNSIESRVAFGIICALVLFASFKRLRIGKRMSNVALWAALAVIVPLALIFLLNPYIHFLSDGWWHAAVYAMLKHTSVPPMNPWFANAPLAYPFSLHLLLVYLFGTTNIPAYLLLIGATLVCAAITSLLFYQMIREQLKDRVAFAGTITLFLLSTIGSIMFLIDLVRMLPSGLSAYLQFLHVHEGPHMWYTALKFVNSVGLNTVFQNEAMLAFFPLLLFVGVVTMLVRKRYLFAAIMYFPLLAANPIYAIIAGLFIAAVLWHDYGWKGLLGSVGIGLSAAVVNSVYLRVLFTKQIVAGGGFVSLFSGKGLWMLLVFLIGYLPFIVLTLIEYRRKLFSRRTKILFCYFAAINLLILLTIELSYLYISTTLFIMLALFSAPYISRWRARFNGQFVRTAIIGITLLSTLLIVATYSYYTIHLNQSELAASEWIRTNTPENSVVLEYFGPLEQRDLFIYPPVFAERPVYIADIIGLKAYGETYEQEKAVYDKIFIEHQQQALCTSGVSYVYVPAHRNETLSWLASAPCLRVVYDVDGTTVYSLQ